MELVIGGCAKLRQKKPQSFLKGGTISKTSKESVEIKNLQLNYAALILPSLTSLAKLAVPFLEIVLNALVVNLTVTNLFNS